MTAPIRAGTWSTALPDWKDRILAGRSLVPALPLFEAVADKALAIFMRLRVPDIIGNPTYGEVCGQWVFDFVRAVFGCYDPETKRRQLQEFFLLVPKKNGKSAIAAAIMVTAAILNERPMAELLLIAPTITIAGISFGQAAGIIRLDEDLGKLFHIQDHLKRITHRVTGAMLEVKAAAPDVITGSKAAFVLIDELHVFAEMSKAAQVMTEIEGGLASRPEGFVLHITTQSKTPPSGVFREKLQQARAVRDGRLQLPMLAVLYELPLEVGRDGGWRDEATWPLVNPNLGRSVDPQFLRTQLAKADEAGPAALALLASQHFNVEVGAGMATDTWPGAAYWDAAAEPGLTLEAVIARCEVCTVGVDGGGLDDLFAVAVFGREAETRDWLLWVRAWAQADVLDRRKEIAPRLLDFARDGDLVLVEDSQQMVGEATDIVERLDQAGLLPDGTPGVGLDAYGIDALLDELDSRSLGGDRLTSIGQGWKLQQAVLGMPLRLKERRLRHAGSAMMAWVVGNARAELKGSNWIVTKQTAGSAKIDPLMASFNAYMLMAGNPVARGSSVYETRGIRMVG